MLGPNPLPGSQRRTWPGLAALLGFIEKAWATAAQAELNQLAGGGGWLICSWLCSCAGAADADADADSSAAADVTIPPRQWRGWRPACGSGMRLYTLQAVGARCDWQSLAGWHRISIKAR